MLRPEWITKKTAAKRNIRFEIESKIRVRVIFFLFFFYGCMLVINLNARSTGGILQSFCTINVEFSLWISLGAQSQCYFLIWRVYMLLVFWCCRWRVPHIKWIVIRAYYKSSTPIVSQINIRRKNKTVSFNQLNWKPKNEWHHQWCIWYNAAAYVIQIFTILS